MTMNKRKLSCVCFFFAALALILCISLLLQSEQHSCAGVRILSEGEYAGLSVSDDPFPVHLLMQNDHPATIDFDTYTVYVSINASELSQPQYFSSHLSFRLPEYRLCFSPDPYFSDMENAVKENHPFELLLVRGSQFTALSVVFTTLPVLELTTERYGEDDGRNYGTFTLRDPYALESGYSIADSQAEWHLRGGSTKIEEKPSYKISLKKQDFIENHHLDLVGLGEDDDWILNPLIMDDLKLREKVIGSLWNSLQEKEGSTLKMSEGEYVEVIMDRRYYGLCMLQRRIDNKYLGENHAADVILKGNAPAHFDSADAIYRIKFNPAGIPEEDICHSMTPYFYAKTSAALLDRIPNVNIGNWLDVNVFMSAFHLYDNAEYRNMIYLLSNQELQFIPWDVDISMGILWTESDGIIFDADQMINSDLCLIMEAPAFFSLDPTLKNRLATRWQQLRSTTLSLSSIQNTIYACHDLLSLSGALLRDQAKWGLRYEGKDTLDNLLSNLELHLERMDKLYQEFPTGN